MSVSSLDSATGPVLDAMTATHEALVDAVHGFEVMIERAEPVIRTTLAEVRDANQQQADELETFLASHGREAPGDGSYMSAVHEGVVRARSLFTDIDEGVLPAVADGERRLVSSYDDALEQLAEHMDELPRGIFDGMHTILTVHRGQIEETVNRLVVKHRALDT
ncbi:DUF2383 domain-containing protein [Hoeflea sp.]|uniref:DUF2383 domain-containing protein n=1 Tax=Hoeflea sp. TaxID=1940281 RepID=UPI003BB0A49E